MFAAGMFCVFIYVYVHAYICVYIYVDREGQGVKSEYLFAEGLLLAEEHRDAMTHVHA
jgi:hypothetical protein